jgi:DNA-binding transcriptional MerR regulator
VESRVEKVGAFLQAEASRCVSYAEIERLTGERGFPTSVRTIRFYVNEGILPAPWKQGNTPVYPREEILALLFSIHVMKTRFSRTLTQIRRILGHLQGEPELLAEKLALLCEEAHREGRHRVEQEWLVETYFGALDGSSDHYPRAKRGRPGPRGADEVLLLELLEDLERGRWVRNELGETVWESPTEVISAEIEREAPVAERRGSEVWSSASVTPLELPAGAVDIDEARRREEHFLRRFEQNLASIERIYSPVERRSYAIREGLLDPQVEDPYQRVVDILKEKGIYDRTLLERLPHDRATRFTLPPRGLFGRRMPKLVVAGVAASPIARLATVGGSARSLGEADLARVIREQMRHRGAFHLLGVLSTVGWEESLHRAPPHQEDLAVVLVDQAEGGGWRVSHSLPKELAALAMAFDPETIEEKVRRLFHRVIEHPELRIPGGHVAVDGFLAEVCLPRELLDRAMRQVTHEDSRLKIVTVSGRELLKRDRF